MCQVMLIQHPQSSHSIHYERHDEIKDVGCMTLLLLLDDMGILKDLFTSHIFNQLCVVSSLDVLDFFFFLAPKLSVFCFLEQLIMSLVKKLKVACLPISTCLYVLFFVCFSSLKLFFVNIAKNISFYMPCFCAYQEVLPRLCESCNIKKRQYMSENTAGRRDF